MNTQNKRSWRKSWAIALTGLLILTGCNTTSETKEVQMEQKVEEVMQNITYADFLKKVENKESFISLIASDKCSHCRELRNFLKDNSAMFKGKGKIYVLELTKLTKKESEHLANKYPKLRTVPTTYYFKNGEVVDEQVGATPTYVTWVLDNFDKIAKGA